MKNLTKILMLTIMLALAAGIANAAMWVKNANNCPDVYQSVNCVPNKVCGYDTITHCADPATTNASIPGTVNTDSAQYNSSLTGGYVLDCVKNAATCTPWVCQRDDTCYNTVHRATTCTGGTTTFTCSATCVSGYEACDGSTTDGDGCEILDGEGNSDCIGSIPAHNNYLSTGCFCNCNAANQACNNGQVRNDTDGCEITTGSSPYPNSSSQYPNAVYGAACSFSCQSASYNNCDGNQLNGCEIFNTEACTVTSNGGAGTCTGCGATGTDINGNSCACQQEPVKTFYTSTYVNYTSTKPLLYGQQLGTGQLLNLSNGSSVSFAITNGACLQFKDGTTMCSSGTTGGASLWTQTGNNISNTNSGNVGIGTTNPQTKLHVNSSGTTAIQIEGGAGAEPFIQFTQNGVNKNYIQYRNAGYTEYYGNASFIVGNVGIGTSTPTYKFEIYGSAGSGGVARIGSQDYGSTTVLSVAPGNVFFDAAGIVGGRMTINGTTGNVGIGTTSPGNKLSLSLSPNDFTKGIDFVDVNGQYPARINYGSAGGLASGWGLDFQVPTGATTVTTPLSIRGNGNVGIGTTNPSVKLYVNDTSTSSQIIVDTSGARGSSINFRKSGSSYGTVGMAGQVEGNSDNNMSLFAETGNGIKFYTGGSGTAKGIWDTNGNVGIGTTSPAAKLQVEAGNIYIKDPSDSTVRSIYFVPSDNSGRNYISGYQTGTPANDYLQIGTMYGSVRINTNAGEIVRVTAGGNVGIGTTTPSTKLHVSGGNALFDNVAIGSGADVNSGLRIVAPISTTHYNWMIGAQQNINAGFEITPSTAVGGTTFSTPAVTILAGGNVGIGTTTPTTGHLQVQGTNPGQQIFSVSTATSGTNYGIDAEATGTGTVTSNTGGYFVASGGATNYGIYIYSPPAGANNYALYSNSAAQSYFAGKLTVNSNISVNNAISSPTGNVVIIIGT